MKALTSSLSSLRMPKLGTNTKPNLAKTVSLNITAKDAEEANAAIDQRAQQEAFSTSAKEMETMRLEIQALREANSSLVFVNSSLVSQQITKETEIRLTEAKRARSPATLRKLMEW